MIISSLSPLRARKSDNYRDSWNNENFNEKNHKKNKKTDRTNEARAITLQGAIEKSPILLLQ